MLHSEDAMKRLFLLPLALLICHCHSPMNHRTNEFQTMDQKTTSLEFKTLGLAVKTKWLMGPVGSIQATNTLLVSVYDAEGELVDLPNDLQLQFYATMPSMGHPLDDAGTFTKIATGLYLNTTIKYNMSGDWQNEIWLMDSNFKIHGTVQWLEVF
jgi:hypothetical protein